MNKRNKAISQLLKIASNYANQAKSLIDYNNNLETIDSAHLQQSLEIMEKIQYGASKLNKEYKRIKRYRSNALLGKMISWHIDFLTNIETEIYTLIKK